MILYEKVMILYEKYVYPETTKCTPKYPNTNERYQQEIPNILTYIPNITITKTENYLVE